MVQACKKDRYFCDDTHCTTEKKMFCSAFIKRGDNRSAKEKHKQNKIVNVIDNINIIYKPCIYMLLFINKDNWEQNNQNIQNNKIKITGKLIVINYK